MELTLSGDPSCIVELGIILYINNSNERAETLECEIECFTVFALDLYALSLNHSAANFAFRSLDKVLRSHNGIKRLCHMSTLNVLWY